ncbi:rab-GTPase-TBC domain protein (macronuclear) [Tetrahymena thermophila SB210]|uniref:Rab-GTPase-TBC domain protein n=1 Tax=Tetrahymena thermophila (strain SB210) TaxID=312017 RepID=Q23PV9_TETTS|nr:rab-GTPase-TBC domain protein [Tetrahymena thermophila SB210]EAR98576.2 rab-GTPase-TBC domain protein [Tetrahymena thermophila SB210]|eukprot:XP_001018821.2 rab-GTPase-TBC domain protein [Tetrahymena thermophila SB210]
MKQSQFLLNNKIGEQQHKDSTIEKYYKLKKPQQLAEIALDKSESDSFFRWRRYRQSILIYFNRYKSDKQNIQKNQEFKEQAKYSANNEQFLNILKQHTENTTSSNKKFRKILKNILSRKLLDERYRKRTWMIASNAIMNKNQDMSYYQQLKNTKDFPDYHINAINQDVQRTIFKQNKEVMSQQLRDILICYQRRNPVIGYCQGMNYIVCFLLDLEFSEEEAFWILVQVLENILPIDFFPNFMLGLLCDLKIFNDLLKYFNIKIWKKFQEVQIDTSIILTHWLVCLFTNSVQKQVLQVIWDHLFAKGSVALFKASLIFFEICQEEILQGKGIEILNKIEEKISKYDDCVTFNQRMSKLYISKKSINVLRDLYRQIFHLEIEKDQEKIRSRLRQFYIKRQNISCNLEWPICHHYLEREKLIQEKDFDHFILREKKLPPQITDYYALREENQNPYNTDNHDINVGQIQQQNMHQNPQIDETNNISDFDISHLEVIKNNANITQLDRDLQIHEISQIAIKYKQQQNLNQNDGSPLLAETLKKTEQQQERECTDEEETKENQQAPSTEQEQEQQQMQKQIQEQENEKINYDFVSFLDEIDLKFNNDKANSNTNQKTSSSQQSDELFIMRTPHICHLKDQEVHDLYEQKVEQNPLQQYIQSLSENNGLNNREDQQLPPQSVQFIKNFTPREVFSELVFRDVSSYDSQFDEL